MKSKKSQHPVVEALELSWTHLGARYRITPWPEVACERRSELRWEAVEPDTGLLASAAAALDESQWRRYLEYVPGEVRSYLTRFRCGRLAALWVLARCPSLGGVLVRFPALTSFVASHADLRGTSGQRWSEIDVIHERSGVFGLLEWLGLPASRQTLTVLDHLLDPDLPLRLLEPLRAGLWGPSLMHAFEKCGVLPAGESRNSHHPLAA